MSLTMSQGDGMTVISVTTNPKSKWPLLCQILGTLCYSPVCSVAQKPKRKLTNTQTTFGVVQMIVGVINIVLGILLASFGIYSVITDCRAPFWLGGMFLAVGIVCILAAKFPSPCLLVITVILNIVSAGLAIAAVVLYSVDVAVGSYQWCDHYYNDSTPSPEQRTATELCQYYKHLNQMILGGLDIMMIVLAALQLCVTISFCVVTLKALCEKSGAAKSVEDPQLYKPLLEDAAANPAC
ncbi:transmembrane protein 176A-like [Triplophysa dalaica]|uniref:transmembrane protein 176A-like n=1 Tax=Triplophysa dalaica TaxID=1582913 RepID=UPI0024DF5FBE|nr:transmembrane protein 176A-like [Triplophysa dalaica]XP_056617756.1 transmembrane protein 176A-like [Triplophysa dalaica]